MEKVALFITHKALPGKREDVKSVWERHMRPQITKNEAHEAYFYCFDKVDPDIIRVYQQYASAEASRAFLETRSYAEYLEEVGVLLAEQPEVMAATPVWIKNA